MKYALISDIHGNLSALKAVLEDARGQGVDKYLFLGDYFEDLPWPNEVTETIRTLDNATVIRGNKEGYLERMSSEDQTGWVWDQMAPLYWNYRELTAENKAYLLALPSTCEERGQNGVRISMRHAWSLFYRIPRVEAFHSSRYFARMQKEPFSHNEYLAFSREAIMGDAGAAADIEALPGGVYAFGHNHLQWHMRVGDRLFVNPGSCGMSLNCDNRAMYTILEEEGGGVRVDERRVTYEVEAAIRALEASELYAQARVWSRIMIEHLRTGSEYLAFFLRHAQELMRVKGYEAGWIRNEVWREAVNTFEMIDLKE